MNEIIFDSNIFANGMHLRGSTKTGVDLRTTSERVCNTCGRYRDKKCKYLGKIKYPDRVYCSWYIDDEAEVKTIRGYRRIK
ncbi:hypothetical protein ES708_25717 [subsurface metagenome]